MTTPFIMSVRILCVFICSRSFMKKRILFFELAFVFILACVAEATNIPDANLPRETEPAISAEGGDLSSQIDSLMASYFESTSPGGAVMVIQNGGIVYQNGYGLADVENGAPITTDTVFHLGSVGKQFTAMGIMMLVEQGRLNYDDPISNYLPELKWMGDEVTVRRLLHHTSGILGYDDSDEIYDALVASADLPTNDDLLNVLAEVGDFQSDPGEQYSYSNTGYDILGALIEHVSGQTYSAFMSDHIFEPLKMTHTFAMPNNQRLNGKNVAASYYFENGKPWAYEPDPLDLLSGSGSIYSTVGDMFLFDQALYTDELVSQETLADAFVSGVLNNGEETEYGFALDLGEYAGETYAAHSGAWLGFESYYLRFPERNLSVVVLLNFDYLETGAEGMSFEIADVYLK